MTAVIGSTFDGATSGNATPATTGASSEFGTASSRQHSTVQKINGASMLCTGTDTSYLQWNVTAIANLFTRLYFFLESAPSTSAAPACSFAVVRSATLINARLTFAPTTAGIAVTNGSTPVATYPITRGQWYRGDWTTQMGVGQMLRLYTGATLHSPDPANAVAGGALLAMSGTGGFDRLFLGQQFPATPAVDFYLDELAADDTALPPPFIPPEPPPSAVPWSYWRPGSWSDALIKEPGDPV